MKKTRENFPEFTKIRKARVSKTGGNYSVTVVPASMLRHILVRQRGFGGTCCRH
jgi:hypothetical protein